MSENQGNSDSNKRQLGDYLLLERIGQGGMGVVYRAQHQMLGQTVALKVLPETFSIGPKVVERFRREMQAIGSLVHPNIVRAYNAGEDNGTLFLAMEYIDGITFRQLVESQGPLPVGVACELIRQASLGLQHAHENGMVHRDIKPGNLMVDRA